MAQTATITISAVNYTVYGLTSNAVTDATNYFGGLLRGATFTNATTLQKQQALIEAARWIDRTAWEGTLTVSSQATAFPRDGLSDGEGVELADNTIPDAIAYGEFELALSLLQNLGVVNSPGAASNITSLTAGPVSVTFAGVAAAGGTSLGIYQVFPTIAQQIMAPFLAGSGYDTGPIAAGTGEDSAFDTGDDETDDFGLTQGLP